MQKNHILLLKKWKNTENAQLWIIFSFSHLVAVIFLTAHPLQALDMQQLTLTARWQMFPHRLHLTMSSWKHLHANSQLVKLELSGCNARFQRQAQQEVTRFRNTFNFLLCEFSKAGNCAFAQFFGAQVSKFLGYIVGALFSHFGCGSS